MKGATIGAVQIIVVVFLFSFGGFLAAWSGLFVPTGPDDYGNTILFTLLANEQGATVPVVSAAFLLGAVTGCLAPPSGPLLSAAETVTVQPVPSPSLPHSTKFSAISAFHFVSLPSYSRSDFASRLDSLFGPFL